MKKIATLLTILIIVSSCTEDNKNKEKTPEFVTYHEWFELKGWKDYCTVYAYYYDEDSKELAEETYPYEVYYKDNHYVAIPAGYKSGATVKINSTPEKSPVQLGSFRKGGKNFNAKISHYVMTFYCNI